MTENEKCSVVQIDELYQLRWPVPLSLRPMLKHAFLIIAINCRENSEAMKVKEEMDKLLSAGLLDSVFAYKPGEAIGSLALRASLADISFVAVPRKRPTLKE